MKEIIVFFISGKEYGVEISGMQSLENYQEIIPFSGAPKCILGTVTIRDEVYPVYDIKSKFALPSAEVTEDTKILLLKTSAGTIACVVDDVGKVFRAEGENVQPFPQVARTDATAYINFIAKRNNELIVVINPDALLTEEEAKQVSKIDFSEEQKENGN